ncbi:MAG: PaaI family thioesterase [Thermoplasmatota archaeon]
MTSEARRRTVEWSDPMALAAKLEGRSGREFLDLLLKEGFPPPPIAVLLDFTLVEVADGRAVFEYHPHESHYNPLGSVHGGATAAVFDAALGCAIHTKIPAGSGYTTIELSVNYLRPVTKDTGTMRCVADTIHVGRTIATARAELRDQAGKLYAHATTTCAVFGR